MPRNAECDLCPGCESTQQVCLWGVGPTRRGTIMLVGERPGHEEDALGVPFVGPAGVFLNSLPDMPHTHTVDDVQAFFSGLEPACAGSVQGAPS